jgi:large subunit ribosomal protein L22
MATTRTTPDGRPEVRAQARWLRIPPRKARLTVDHIRGRTVPEARTVLAFTERAAAREVEKVLRSAVANAEANHGLLGDELIVWRATVDEGPTIKRWRARARGRAAPIAKRTCHITLTLTTLEAAPDKRKRSRLPRKDAEAEPQAEGAAQEQASARREAKAEAAQEGGPLASTSAAEEAEGAASEEKPKRTRRKKKEEG